MTRWLTVALVGAATVVIKSIGPVLLGGRQLPERVRRIVALLAPALLAALVVVQAFGQGQSLVVDERLFGLSAACVALLMRSPTLLVVVVAAAATALARAVG